MHDAKFINLTLCQHDFLSPVDFFKIKSNISKNSFKNTIRVSNSIDTDEAQHFVGPYLQRL